ncbi:MAG: pyridoxal kinase PdxY [Phyllobacterium sp.]
MKTILSIQSHVAYGHVGNSAAVFPLQRLGHKVIAINTVQFSNHTGYGAWKGQVFSADHIRDVLEGLKERDVLSGVDALLTGYLGDQTTGDIILEVLSSLSSNAIWLCDPVMGDVGRGFFVREGIPDFFRNRALPRANIITPNQFELEYLSGMTVESLANAQAACRALHKTGPGIVLLTSLIHKDTKPNTIQMLISSKGGEQYVVTTPMLPFSVAPNGAGDCTSALLLAHILSGATLPDALGKVAASIYALFEETLKSGHRELALIASQDHFVSAVPFEVTAL